MLFTRVRRWQRNLHSWFVQKYFTRKLEELTEDFVRRFESFLTAGSQVLDIGGAWGFYFEPLVRRGHFVTVLDVAKPTYQRTPVVLYDSDGPFPFPDKSFDISLIVTVLHHADHPERILDEAIRVTRKTIIIVEDLYRHPCGKFWTVLRDQIYNFEYFGHPKQFRTAQGWQDLFKEKKLESVYFEELYTWLSGLRILNGIFVLKV